MVFYLCEFKFYGDFKLWYFTCVSSSSMVILSYVILPEWVQVLWWFWAMVFYLCELKFYGDFELWYLLLSPTPSFSKYVIEQNKALAYLHI